MKILTGLLVLFSCLSNVFSQESYSGTCSQFGNTRLSPFWQYRYMGLWYIHGVYDYSDIVGRDCLTSYYYGTSRFASIVERSKDLKTMQWREMNSLMTLNENRTGNYEYGIPEQGVANWLIDIIATDYTTYSIEWSCVPSGTNSGCYLWLMSRFPKVPRNFWTKVDPVLKQHRISKTNLRIINHDKELCSD